MTAPRIAFAGLMRSGKDTSVNYLLKKHGGMHLKLADPLYLILNCAQDLAGLPREKDRKFLQWIGTDWGRSIDENIWVDALVRRVEQVGADTPIFVSDARFKNEFDALKAAGFIIIKLNRPEDARMADERPLTRWEKFKRLLGIKPKFATHASERDVLTYQDFDFEISNNNGPLEALYRKLDMVVNIAFGPVV